MRLDLNLAFRGLNGGCLVSSAGIGVLDVGHSVTDIHELTDIHE